MKIDIPHHEDEEWAIMLDDREVGLVGLKADGRWVARSYEGIFPATAATRREAVRKLIEAGDLPDVEP